MIVHTPVRKIRSTSTDCGASVKALTVDKHQSRHRQSPADRILHKSTYNSFKNVHGKNGQAHTFSTLVVYATHQFHWFFLGVPLGGFSSRLGRQRFLKHASSALPLSQDYVYHIITLSHYHIIISSHWHNITSSYVSSHSHIIILSKYHVITASQDHNITLSRYHIITILQHHTQCVFKCVEKVIPLGLVGCKGKLQGRWLRWSSRQFLHMISRLHDWSIYFQVSRSHAVGVTTTETMIYGKMHSSTS